MSTGLVSAYLSAVLSKEGGGGGGGNWGCRGEGGVACWTIVMCAGE